ncbi:hypothetical protein J2X65_001277 [Ancylobacter sp. 3268]|uniref:hypothetical protein n=1 Tax=Ancylobacter sp. 3268 TaxID=2817752 RepID=UPI00286668DC|nr:hypothetical protein [Ancylobacter sp. 3268]MDR6951926.1 hypothetical protein [Ancylobacter sp. 3268]
MSKLRAPKFFRYAVLLPVLAAAFAAGAAWPVPPARAQVYYRPYAPPPGYVPVPRYAPRAYPAPGSVYRPAIAPPYSPPVMPRADMRPMLSSMGLRNISRPRTDGQFYVSEATDAMGRRVQVRVNAYSGAIVSMRPLGPAVPVTPPGAGSTPLPVTTVLPPRKPPLPPSPHAPLSTNLPEAGASTPGGAQRPVDPMPSALPQISPPASGGASINAPKPSVAAVPPAGNDPAPAEAAKPAEAAAPGAVRVIPGVATPPNAAQPGNASTGSAAPGPASASPSSTGAAPPAGAPAVAPVVTPETAARPPNALEARAGVSTGAGAGAAEVPAGTASVVVREVNEPPRPTPKPPIQ